MKQSIETIQVENVLIIKLNRPDKKNAFNFSLFEELAEEFRAVVKNEHIRVVLLTGNGEFFSSGLDFSIFFGISGVDSPEFATVNARLANDVKDLVNALLDCPKFIVAAVNGPSYGIGVTILAHCDLAYASSKATFTTPFIPLGILPEAASSYTFPMMMGTQKATEVLLTAKTLTASVAKDCRLVVDVLDDQNFFDQCLDIAKSLGQLPPMAVQNGKKLIRGDRQKINQALEAETVALEKQLNTGDILKSIEKFRQQRTKSTTRPSSKL